MTPPWNRHDIDFQQESLWILEWALKICLQHIEPVSLENKKTIYPIYSLGLKIGILASSPYETAKIFDLFNELGSWPILFYFAS